MSSFRVLVVDNDPVLNFACCETLKEGGFSAVGVHCAAAAFEVMDKGAGLSALVTDIDLGAGPDGFEVARRARAVDPRLPVIFISGMAAARQRAGRFEGSEFLGKPFGAPEIIEAMHRVFPRKTGTG
jgi:two-component system OmpR family response regulator